MLGFLASTQPTGDAIALPDEAIAVTTFDRQMIIQKQMLTTRSPLPTFLTIRKPTRDRRHSQESFGPFGPAP
jgi:hypothetical protein